MGEYRVVWYTTWFYPRVFTVPHLFLHADDSCLMFQHKIVEKIGKVLINDFENICGWIVEKKLSVHFSGDKFKLILFASQRKFKNMNKLKGTLMQI